MCQGMPAGREGPCSLVPMRIQMRLEIHFHQQDQASVFLESGTPADEERFGEVVLASLFIARMLVNLGSRNPAALGLAEILSQAGGAGLRQLALYDSPDSPRLAPYQGSKGRKGFIAILGASDEILRFSSKSWGMGLMARGAGYYAPNAAMLLLRHFVTRREDEEYIDALGEVGRSLGTAFLTGQLSVRSQAQIAMMAASQGGIDLMPSESD